MSTGHSQALCRVEALYIFSVDTMIMREKRMFFPCSDGAVGRAALPIAAQGQVVTGPGPFLSGAAPSCHAAWLP